MLLTQLEAFVEAARRGNVSRAAEALFVTQPALTARLKRLERDLGVELFVRTGRGVRLTDAGRAFLPYAQRTLDAVTEGRRARSPTSPRRRRRARHRRGARRLHVRPAGDARALPRQPPQRAARGAHGPLRGGARARAARARSRSASIRALRHPDVESMPLYEDELVLVAHPDHRFAGAGEIEVEELGERAAHPLRPDVELPRPHERAASARRASFRVASWSSTTSTPRRRWCGRASASRCCRTRPSPRSSRPGRCEPIGSSTRRPSAARSSPSAGVTQAHRGLVAAFLATIEVLRGQLERASAGLLVE